ncbi:MAG: chemotaxis response regulator protein-glutamate methylesterase [Methylobacter sp.]|nr:MAG: chemotaxis response regulator protein-glutamate methylesterase [Methylobacter sp.]
MAKIRLIVVDDSALIRKVLTEIFNSDPDLEVVGVAADPFIARDLIKQLNPDMITLDVEMPRMDGISFLRNLMRLRPMPVVMISTLTEKNADVTLQALALGAVDYMPKPTVNVTKTLNDYAEELIAKVKTAAKAKIKYTEKSVAPAPGKAPVEPQEKHGVDAIIRADASSRPGKTRDKIIAIGASTGGTEAIKAVVKELPADTPAIVITQHLPAAFSQSFARHVDMASKMRACIASHGQVVEPGTIYIAPGDQHMLLARDGNQYVIQLNDGVPVNRHKPAVDVLFRSVAQTAGANAVGVMLTGMGADGAIGMKEMHDAGAKTVVQDEQTSVVWGMPGEAYKLGCADFVKPLQDVAGQILAMLK